MFAEGLPTFNGPSCLCKGNKRLAETNECLSLGKKCYGFNPLCQLLLCALEQ